MSLDWDGFDRTKSKRRSHLRHLWDLSAPWKLGEVATDDIRVVSPMALYRVVTDSFKGNKKFLTESQINIYTDGSKTEKGVGAGFVITKNKLELKIGEIRLDDICTVYQAEVFAIFEAVRSLIIDPRFEGIRFVNIFSDSMAALYSLKKRTCRSEVVHNTMKILNKLAQKGVTVSLVWIRAHVGHPGNERADCLAKEDTSPENVNKAWVKLPGNSLKKKSAIRAHSVWIREWLDYKNARMFKQFYPSINLDMSDALIGLCREDLTNIITMISGHNDLRYHFSLRNPNTDPNCRLCGDPRETFFHLYTDCPRLNTLRFNVTGKYNLGDAAGWSPDTIIQFIRELPFSIRDPNPSYCYNYSSSSLFESGGDLSLSSLWGDDPS